MPGMDRTDNYISVIGAHYVPDIVLDFLPRIFDAYKMRDYTSTNFQVSTRENIFSTAGILLTVVSMESYGNRILQLEKTTEKLSLLKLLPRVFRCTREDFPDDDFKVLLQELYILRDIIAHNHIYAISTTVDGDSWNIKHCDEKLVLGRGPDDLKYKNRVDLSKNRTKLLKLHAQPLKIGFEDLFTVLIIFDLFIRLAQSIFGYFHVPFQIHYKIGKSIEPSLSRLLTHYYRQISNDKYLASLESLLKGLRSRYSPFLTHPYDDVFIKNICPQPDCGAFGFRTINRLNNCKACGFSIKVSSVP